MTPTPYPAPAPTPSPATLETASSTGRGRRWAAVVIAVVGIVAGVVLWIVGGARYDDGVRSLARAPVGCDTTLDFAEAGDYLVFVETRGEFPDVRGDCELRGAFDLGDAAAPTPDVRVVDPAGDEVALLSRRGREDYDRAGSRGESFARITIAEPGDHVVRVESSGDTAFAVAIGRDPADGVTLLRLTGIGLAFAGIIVAVVLAFTGRPRRPAPAPPTAMSQPGFGGSTWGTPPPSGPPPMQSPQGPPPAGATGWMPPAAPPPGAPSSAPPGAGAPWLPQPPPEGQGAGPAWQPQPPPEGQGGGPAWQPQPPPDGQGAGPAWQPQPPSENPAPPGQQPPAGSGASTTPWPTVAWPTTTDPSPWDEADRGPGSPANEDLPRSGDREPGDGDDGDDRTRFTPPS